MNEENKSPLQEEFEQSQTYRAIRMVGREVRKGLQDAGIDDRTLDRGIDMAAEGFSRAVETVSRELDAAVQRQNTTYRGEVKSRRIYSPPAGAQTPPQPVKQTPPPQTQPPVRPVPVQNGMKMEVRRKPSNAKFWLTGATVALYSMVLPMHNWFHLAALGLIGIGVFALSSHFLGTKKVYVPVAENEPEPQPVKEPAAQPKKKASTGDPEVDKIIDEGHEYLHQLRFANDCIEDTVMSDRIARMEAASADIFAYIAEHPEKAPQIRRFMNYYLPTTLKLLTSYDKLSRQRVKGENIQKTMFEIEGMMETIASAFEKQLDSLFSTEAMDISADISVMESVLKQEGLSGEDMPKVQPAGAAAVQTESGFPGLTLNPEEEK